MFTQKARTIAGADSRKTSPLKNDSWTAGQPGELTTTQPTKPKKTTVLAPAMRADRVAAPSRGGPKMRAAGRSGGAVGSPGPGVGPGPAIVAAGRRTR